MKNRLQKIAALFFCCSLILQFALFEIAKAEIKNDYTLEKIVIYSRHNLRAPLDITPDSLLFQVTPHKWNSYSVKSGELSVKGGELEILMGQYFKNWLENENFITENYVPKEGEFRFYANSFQRTIATAKYFSCGMLPIANINVERKYALNKFDPVFQYISNNLPSNASFKQQIEKEINLLNPKQIGEKRKSEVQLVESILDFKNSIYAKKNNTQTFLTNGKEYFSVTVDKILHLEGSERPAMKVADALILQYYETGNSEIFGRKLTDDEWRGIGQLQSTGLYSLFHLPSLSKIATKSMLKTLKDELLLSERRFTFLCGHDIGIAGTLSAIGVEDYELPETVEPVIPIGVKFVIEKRRGKDGKAYASLKLMYQSVKQIKNREILTTNNPPVTVNLRLKGLKQNEDGFYLFDDLMKRLDESLQ